MSAPEGKTDVPREPGHFRFFAAVDGWQYSRKWRRGTKMIERVSFRHLLTRLCIGLAAIPLSIGATSSSLAQERPDHADSTPATAVANSNALVKLPALLAEQYPTIQSLVLARRGCVEFEYYKAGLDARSLSPVHSITKSVLSVLVGIALDRGYLRLDKKLSELLPEVLDPTIDPHVRDITIRDLLTMTSGFDSAAPFGAKVGGSPPEMWQWILNRQMPYTPGAHFNYDNDSANLLSVALTRAIRQSSRTFAEQNLFRPLEITHFNWIADSDGYLIGADTLSLTARDMAKIGLLYLQRGRWDNKQIVSSDYVADSTAKHNDGGAPTGAAYGYLWWLKQTKTDPDAFFAAGSGSQLIYVVPKFDLVMAMASSSNITGGNVRFVNDVVLPAASVTPSSPTCIGQLVQGQPLH
jgi:CubicO group peptidase (beta-lactamase class C family)